MPRRIQILIECDLCGQPTDDVSDTVALGRKTVEIDLCESHRDELHEFLTPILAAGHRPEGQPVTVQRRGSPKPTMWSRGDLRECRKGCGGRFHVGPPIGAHEAHCDGAPGTGGICPECEAGPYRSKVKLSAHVRKVHPAGVAA